GYRPSLSPPDPAEPAGRPIANEKSLNVFGELDLRVILWLVAQDLAGIGQRPESTGVVTNAVHYLPGDAVFVLDMGSIDGFAEQLREVARTDIGSQVAFVGHGVVLVQGDVEFTRRANAYHHHAQLAGRIEVGARMLFPTAGITEIHAAAGK